MGSPFLNDLRDCTESGIKILFNFGSSRSHMSLWVIEYPEANNIIVFSLPAHRAEKTQLLDVKLFWIFKNIWNKLIGSVSDLLELDRYSKSDFVRMVTSDYHESFIKTIIIPLFRRPSLWTIESSCLLVVPRSEIPSNLQKLLSIDGIEHKLVEEGVTHRIVFSLSVSLLSDAGLSIWHTVLSSHHLSRSKNLSRKWLSVYCWDKKRNCSGKYHIATWH